MEDKCPFCGAEVDNPGEPFTWYQCYTTFGTETEEPPIWTRSETCYERQIAILQTQVVGLHQAIREETPVIVELKSILKENCGDIFAVNLGISWGRLQALLSPTPAGEWVSVRREDLAYVVSQYEEVAGVVFTSNLEGGGPMNRLKAALKDLQNA